MKRRSVPSFKKWLKKQAWHYRRGSRRDAVASFAYVDVDFPEGGFPDHEPGTGARTILRDCREYINDSYTDPALDTEWSEARDALTAAVREYFTAYPLPKPSKGEKDENDTAEIVRQIEDIYRSTGLRVSPAKGSVKTEETYSYG